MPNTGWWYSFVTASPLPETGEAVNVGVVIGNGEIDQVAFAPGLPRLGGLVRLSERKAYEDVLRVVQEDARRGIDLDSLKATIGPQMQIGVRRELRYAPDKPIVDILIRRYLAGAGFPTQEDEAKLVWRSRKELDEAIARVVNISMERIEERPSAQSLYPNVSAFRDKKVPRLGRALVGPRRDLLIDALILEPGKTTLAVRSATQRIGRAFWYYDRYKADIRIETGKELRLVGVLINNDGDSSEVADASAYIEENWKQHAEVRQASKQQHGLGLQQDAQWLAG
jgi:hypothetical protein